MALSTWRQSLARPSGSGEASAGTRSSAATAPARRRRASCTGGRGGWRRHSPPGAPGEGGGQVAPVCPKYRDRGVVAVGLGGLEAEYPPEPYEAAFTLAASLGLGSVPPGGGARGGRSARR